MFFYPIVLSDCRSYKCGIVSAYTYSAYFWLIIDMGCHFLIGKFNLEVQK